MRSLTTTICLLLLLPIFGVSAPSGVQAQQESVFFPETGHTVRGRFLQFWRQHGGLAVFGYPLTEELQEQGRTAQYFERQRFELHPENRAPYDVELGLLGVEILAARGIDWRTQPTSPGRVAGCAYFEVTRHNVCNQQGGSGFLSYWTTHGLEFDGRTGKSFAESLALFGYPITEPYQYTNSSGDTVQAQWFERARFEWHPNNPRAFSVLLGRLGAELLGARSGSAALQAEIRAVETVISYYDAINERRFDEAYRHWANGGAASNQTFDQFRQGFANTVRVSVLLGQPIVHAANSVNVPLAILAVVNVPGGTPDQQVQLYRGSYTVQPMSASEWKLTGASISLERGVDLPLSVVSTPDQVLQSYYGAINRHTFAHAYTSWEDLGRASNQSYADFRQGFVTTDRVMIALGTPQVQGAAGSLYADVPIVVFARQTDLTRQTFCGTYTLRRSNVPPFDLLGWRIWSARIVQVANVEPGSEQAQRLLNGGCPQ